MKIWDEFERLTSEDLNDNFDKATGKAQLFGVLTGAGSGVAPGAGSEGEIKGGTPAGGDDPAGLWQSGNGRIKIPLLGGGLWAVTVIGTISGGTAGDLRQVRIAGGATGLWRQFAGRGASTVTWTLSGHIRVAAPPVGGTELTLLAVPFTTDATFTVTYILLARVGSLVFAAAP